MYNVHRVHSVIHKRKIVLIEKNTRDIDIIKDFNIKGIESLPQTLIF